MKTFDPINYLLSAATLFFAILSAVSMNETRRVERKYSNEMKKIRTEYMQLCNEMVEAEREIKAKPCPHYQEILEQTGTIIKKSLY